MRLQRSNNMIENLVHGGENGPCPLAAPLRTGKTRTPSLIHPEPDRPCGRIPSKFSSIELSSELHAMGVIVTGERFMQSVNLLLSS